MTAPRTIMVAIGEIRTSSDPSEVLTTCVGSCVAVAMQCRRTGVAGLLHAVLPERAQPDDRPSGYYADPGVPLLIEDLLRCGAELGDLTAVVVGGASLALPSDGLVPDPAGRADQVGACNVRAAVRMLREAGIPYRVRDVGGREGRRVSLRVATGEVSVRGTRGTARNDPGPPDPSDAFPKLVDWMSNLGPNPAVAGELLALLHEPFIDWTAVRDVVARDLVLALRVLRLANSTSYGAPRQVGSIEGALAVLGPVQVRRLGVVAATARNAPHTLIDVGDLEPSLRRHSHATALVVDSSSDGLPESARQDAFAAGLVHAVGAIAVCQIAQLQGEEQSIPDAAEVGARILSAWGFPERIVHAVRPQRCVTGEATELADIVHLGCAVAQLTGLPCGLGPTPLCVPLPSNARWKRIERVLSNAGLGRESVVERTRRSL